MNTAAVKELVEKYGIATLKADMTHSAPEAEQMLQALGNKGGSIPFYAVFPADRPNEPILLDGVFTSPSPILEAIRQAGPSTRVAKVGPSRENGPG